MVFAVRTDLKMKTGKMCAQVAHAAVEAARIAEAEEPKLLQLWESHGCAKICLKVLSFMMTGSGGKGARGHACPSPIT